MGADGSVHVASYQLGTVWVQSTLAGSASASLAAAATAIPKQLGQREAWWIGADGSIQAAYFEGDGWNPYTLAGARSASVTGAITAVSKGGVSMEVWWIGADGSIQAAYHDAAWNMYTLAGAGSASLTGAISAVFKDGNDLMEVWWIGADGSIQRRTSRAGGTPTPWPVPEAPHQTARSLPLFGRPRA